MNILKDLSVKLGITRAEMTTVTLLLFFLIVGGVVRYRNSVQDADKLIKRAEAVKFSEAEVDSLLRLASSVDYTAEAESGQSFTEAASVDEPSAHRHAAHASKKNFTGTVAFNSASAAQLQQISGVGPVMAKRLIAFRTEKGGKVKQFDDFLSVKGIGRKKLEVLKMHLTLE